jgi:hypothetical protein
MEPEPEELTQQVVNGEPGREPTLWWLVSLGGCLIIGAYISAWAIVIFTGLLGR